MSMSEWDFTHALADYKNFRQSSRDRLLFEMLRSAEKGDSANDPRSTWKILIMDKVTLKVMSFSCKMADITDQAISLGEFYFPNLIPMVGPMFAFKVSRLKSLMKAQVIVVCLGGFSHCPFITKKENFQPIEKATDGTVVEDIVKRREPLPSMDAIYFMQPTKENMLWFLSDMSGRCPLYRKAYVFFSSPIPRELTAYIKNDASVIPRIGALREMNLEYFAIDSQAFITDHDMALEELFGDNAENSRKYIECVSTMAIRIATAFASLKELPYVRYRAAKSDTRTAQDLVPSRLAAAVWEILSKYKSSVPDFPQKETCDLLIVDRSVDQIAPVIHEWTYDAMIHDLLEMDGNKYIYEAPGKMGAAPERKEALLDDNDPVWLELRHAHIADASERLHEKMSSFVSKNKAAQLQTNSRDGGEISTRDLQKLVQALPQYQEQVEKLSLHVEIAGKINTMIKENGLRSLGQLEQDLVFGDAGAKEMISFLRANQGMSAENKLRLLMIYSTTHPEKFEGDKGLQLMQLAKLSSEDMKVINNMMYLGKMNTKKSRESFSLKFDTQKKKQAARQEKSDEEETWALSRFYPMVEELIEKLSKGELPRNDYPYINEPTATSPAGAPLAASNRTPGSQPAQSIRSRRTATWAKGRNSDDGCSSDSVLKNASLDLKKMGQRIFLFIIGGATRSELRTIHKLTPKLKREVILGTSIIDDPSMFITKLKTLTRKDVPQQKLQI